MVKKFWSVDLLSNGLSRTIKLKVPENYAPLRAFFFEAADTDYPRIIAAAMKGTGIGFDSAGVNFPGDFDPGDESPPEGHVEVYDPIAQVYVAEEDFLLALLDVAQDLLKTHLDRETGDAAWQTEMQIQIAALQERLA